ncbi:MAG TPA: flavin-dependent oxidoreductase [Bauldia sp.]|nr:flavin-dependent oxidoreductase [Bauldia sp.]
MTVLIAGGGIGGLALALSLHQVGVPAMIFESAPEPKALGVGINVLPHAVRELVELGLEPDLEAIGVRTGALAYFSKHGKPIWSELRGKEAGYRWPQFSLHRGTLTQLLWDKTADRLGADSLHTAHHLTGWREVDGGIEATFIDKASGAVSGTRRGALLIGADGIHSAARAHVYPQEGTPRWNGNILWRGVTFARPFLDGRTMIMAGHATLKFVAYPIAPKRADGLQMINWIAERRMPPDYQWRRERYDRQARIEEFLPWFESWRFEWLDIPTLIREALYVYEYPMVDRDPLDRWTFGRMTLAGDAAHPMYPIGSNGASQAILDARVLARAIQTHGETPAALAAYETERRPATARIVATNRRNGPDHVMQIVEERAPDGFSDIEAVMPLAEREAIAADYKRIAGFDRDTLNARPSIILVAQGTNP